MVQVVSKDQYADLRKKLMLSSPVKSIATAAEKRDILSTLNICRQDARYRCSVTRDLYLPQLVDSDDFFSGIPSLWLANYDCKPNLGEGERRLVATGNNIGLRQPPYKFQIASILSFYNFDERISH